MLDGAIDRYLENVSTKSSKTASGYGYTLQQFYRSCRNKLLTSVTTQDLYDFVGYQRREGLGRSACQESAFDRENIVSIKASRRPWHSLYQSFHMPVAHSHVQ
jgi:site-specific recombinase XerD